MRKIIITIFYLLAAQQVAWGGEITLRIGAHSIRADIANTPQSREHGLMEHRKLCPNCGMLFVFPKPGIQYFWMKNTPISLSIAFIAADGSILNLAEMQANTLKVHQSHGEALYALEMNKGWFTQSLIKPRQYVQGLQNLLPGK